VGRKGWCAPVMRRRRGGGQPPAGRPAGRGQIEGAPCDSPCDARLKEPAYQAVDTPTCLAPAALSAPPRPRCSPHVRTWSLQRGSGARAHRPSPHPPALRPLTHLLCARCPLGLLRLRCPDLLQLRLVLLERLQRVEDGPAWRGERTRAPRVRGAGVHGALVRVLDDGF